MNLLPTLTGWPCRRRSFCCCATIYEQGAAQAFVSFLAGPVGKPLFEAAGITD